jgi:Ca-activated chloride channel family protein
MKHVLLLVLTAALAATGCHGTTTCYAPPVARAHRAPTGTAYHTTYFTYHGTNPRVCARDDPRSTFGVDTDDASYLLARAYLRRGRAPERDGVRVEEFVNHFDYDYPRPSSRALALVADGAPSPFDPACHLLRFAVQGADTPRVEDGRLFLTFLVDTSGSMNEESRLDLVKDCLLHLVDRLGPEDRVALVCFADSATVVLEETPVRCRSRIERAIRSLHAAGNTNVGEGLTAAYSVAGHMRGTHATRRIVLCSDGVTNTGETELRRLEQNVRWQREGGIAMSVFGFGLANYDDALLEKIADVGDGVYTYVDALEDVERSFGRGFLRSAPVVARDVRIQVEFDPAVVESWRLLGYENRQLGDASFDDRETDSGALSAGGSATALYEVRLRAEAREAIATFRVSYEDPTTGRREELTYEVPADTVACSFEGADPSLRLAACAAAFAEILRESPHARHLCLDDLRRIVRDLDDGRALRGESLDLLETLERAISLRRWS